MTYRAIHPATLVPDSALGSYLRHQPGEVEVLEVTLINPGPEPDLWMVTYTLRNEEEPAIYWEYLDADDWRP